MRMEFNQRDKLVKLSDFWKSFDNPEFQSRLLGIMKRYTSAKIREEDTLFQETNNYSKNLHEVIAINNNTLTPEEVADIFYKDVVKRDIGLRRPTFFAVIPSSGHLMYSAAQFMASLSHVFTGLRVGCPGGVDIEESVVRWAADIVGYTANARGVMVSGTSMGSIMAFTTARDLSLKTPQDMVNGVVYLSNMTHPCIVRTLKVIGLGHCTVRRVPLDDNGRMDAGHLGTMIVRDKKDGLLPFLVVATLGTTALGIVDPLGDIADVTKKHGVWFHVDAAYGGFLLLDETVKKKAKGVEMSDSVTMDCHKALSAPLGTSVVLVHRGRLLKAAMSHEEASYIKNVTTLEDEEAYSPADYSFEYTRPHRAFPVWFMLKTVGLDAITEHIKEKLELTKYAYKVIKSIPNVEVFSEPDLTVLAFRYSTKSESKTAGNDFTQTWLKRINAEGSVFLSGTHADDTFYIRLCVLSLCSHIEDVDCALETIKHTCQALSSDEKLSK